MAIVLTTGQIRIAKVLVFIACLIPFLLLAAGAFNVLGQTLGANPVEELLHKAGKTGLNILMITLAVTPVRRLTGINALVRFRRMLGLFSFFYVLLHFVTYAALDLSFRWGELGYDITQRPYITVGFTALVFMIPLAITSTNGWQRRLKRRWVQLHRLMYVIVGLSLLHFFWQVKLDTREPLIYSGIAIALLGERAWSAWRRRVARQAQAEKAQAE